MMKIISVISVPLCLLPVAALAIEAPKRQPMRDAPTNEELTQKLRTAVSPLRDLRQVEGPDPSKNLPQDILSRSDILCFDGIATLVPKESILFVPEQYKDRIGIKDGVRIVTWSEFFTANRGWITTQEITFDQAAARVPLEPKVVEDMGRSRTLVVATCQGGPISKVSVAKPVPPTMEIPRYVR